MHESHLLLHYLLIYKNDFKNFMSNLNPSPVRSDHVSNGPCQYCTVFRLGSPAYRTPSSFRMKSRPAAACPDSESRCLEIRDLAAAHPKRPTRGGLRPRGRRRAYELHQGQPPFHPLRRPQKGASSSIPFQCCACLLAVLMYTNLGRDFMF